MIKKKLWRLLPLLLFLAILLFCWRGLSLHPRRLPSTLLNKAVPAFSIAELQQPQQYFSSRQLQGHISLLNVWATWCTNCHWEHPVLLDIARHQDIAIYGLDYKDSRSQAIAWLQQYGNPYRAIGFDEDGQIAMNLGVYGTPETFIIDAKGIIRYKHIGPVTADVWQDEILPEINRLKKQR